LSEEFLTRRQIRELERAGRSVPRPEAKPELTATAAFTLLPELIDPVLALKAEEASTELTRRDLRENQGVSNGQIWPLVPVTNKAVSPPVTETAGAPVTEVASAPINALGDEAAISENSEQSISLPPEEAVEESLFEVSPNLSLEPQTASLVIDQVNDITNLTHVLHNGDILQTGSITLPILSTNTGEMSLVADAAAADNAVNADATTGYVSSITPVRASEVGNFGAQIDIVPSKHQRGEGQLYLALTISVGLVAVGALILGGYMLNIFN